MFAVPFQPQERDRLPNFRHEDRHRPHPNRGFLYWKQPRKYLAPQSAHSYTNDISQTFYQDYSKMNARTNSDRDENEKVQVNPWRRSNNTECVVFLDRPFKRP